MFYKLLLLTFNLILLKALTSLSSKNCPSQFDIAKANITT